MSKQTVKKGVRKRFTQGLYATIDRVFTSSKTAYRVDPALRYYAQIFQTDHLHLGYWEPEDELTLENSHRAQERYTERLIDLIPEGVRTVLDVGCGVGGTALKLRAAGFEVEGLSPDPELGEVFEANTNGTMRFHLARFEDFQPEHRYDLVLMGESAQYIQIDEGFRNCRTVLNDGGFLLVSDFFLRHPLDKYDVLSGGGHLERDYLKAAEEHGFEIIHAEDITDRVAPSLDLALSVYKRYFKPTVLLLDTILEQSLLSIPYRMTRAIFRNWARKMLCDQERLLDSKLFAQHKRYMIYLFQRR
ncbi:MAG: class I SAM-dependent methyltransferase [Candidatus Bipolaricaulia bacterium]